MGSLVSIVINHHLAASNLPILPLMLGDHAMHRRKDRLSGHAILGYVPSNDEVKVRVLKYTSVHADNAREKHFNDDVSQL